MELRCVGCGKTPDEIHEYVQDAKDEEVTPQQFVLQNEGTLNRENGHFYCTRCYVKAGLPLGVAP